MEVIMFNKIVFSLLTLISIHAYTLSPYEASQLPYFGNTQNEIQSYIQSLVNINMSVKDALEWHFDTREQEIIQSINQQYGIHPDSWTYIENLFFDIMAKDPLFKPSTSSMLHRPGEHPILKTARAVLVNCGMNPNAVTIVNSNTTSCGTVSTTLNANRIPLHKLELNVAELSQFTPAEYTALIKHEIQHLWYGDSLKMRLYASILPYYASLSNSSISALFKNLELRADIMSAISSPQDIASLIAWCQKTVYFDGEDPSYNPNHPTFAQRVTALQQTAHYLFEEQKYWAYA